METNQVKDLSEPLLIEDGIKYVYVNEGHKEEVIKIATDSFYEGEPLG